MKTHQVRWSRARENELQFNTLSCFDCPNQCDHYFLRDATYPVDSNSDSSSEKEMSKHTSLNVVSTDDLSSSSLYSPNGSTLSKESSPLNDSKVDISVDDWVVVQFSYENKNGGKKYIGKVVELSGSEYQISFLRPKITKEYKGYIFVFPNILDIVQCVREQILYKIEPPQKWQRALKFCVHEDKL
jgi:hypothetical protein